MIKDILVPVDETPQSERAVSIAATLAGPLGARLELVTVESPHVDAYVTSAYHGRLLESVAPAIERASTVTFSNGPVAEALEDVARARPDSLICMATRANGPVAELVLGSTADRVVRAGDAPVLLVGPACSPTWPDGPTAAVRVVAALDGSGLDHDVVGSALAWSRALGVPVRFVTVTVDLGVPGASSPADEILRRASDAADRAGRPATTAMLEGDDPAGTMLPLLAEHPSLLVVGSHRRGPWARMALGANALWLVHRAPCPVLVAGIEPRRDAA